MVDTRLMRPRACEAFPSQAFEQSLKDLQMDYVDLLLLHYPR